MAKQMLVKGNFRFLNDNMIHRDLMQQVEDTADGQYPFATILSCIDSRVPAETLFDQGLGDIFNVRIAGNFVNTDILGSMEFACKLAGTKLILVLGHTSCGAVKGACDNAKLGNLTKLIANIDPAVQATTDPVEDSKRNSKNLDFVDRVAEKNVQLTISRIRTDSPILADMEELGDIQILGAMYDIESGKVEFMN